MECVTILKPGQDICKYSPGKQRGQLCERCRRCGVQTILNGFFLLCGLISMVALFFVYLKVSELDQKLILQKNISRDLLLWKSILEEQSRHEGRRAKNGSRDTRDAATPVYFVLNGTNVVENEAFLWQRHPRVHLNSEQFPPQQTAGHIRSLTIKCSGFYFLHAFVHVNGRRGPHSSIGSVAAGIRIVIRRQTSDGDTTDLLVAQSFLTQDDRGIGYFDMGRDVYPVDVIQVTGYYSLQRNDQILVKKQPNSPADTYNSGENHASFGGYMIAQHGRC